MLFVAPTDLWPPRGLFCWAGPLCVPVGGGPPARSPHASCARSGRSRSPARPCHRPPAPRQFPPVSSTPAVRRHHRPPAPRQFPPVSSTPVEPGVLMIGSACLLEARPGPAAAWPVLLGRAAVCAGGQRPARSPSAPRAALGASSRSPARPCRRPPAPRPGPAGLAAASNRSGCLCDVRPGPAGPAAPPIGRACRLCVDRLRRRPPAPRSGPPVPPAPSTPAGPGVLVCCSSFRNLACNSPPALCWFVSVCDVTPLVFVNCMRLLLSAGPAVAHRHRGWAVLTFPVLQADQTGCVRG